MPAKASAIAPEENLKYQRVVLARQFRAIQKAVKETSSGTQTAFSAPYQKGDDPLWIDHPMLNESEMLLTECTRDNVIGQVSRGQVRVRLTLCTLHFYL